MRRKMKQLLGVLLTLGLILGLMPGMGLTAYADDDPPYAQYKNTTTEITFDGKPWYLIDYDDSTVTLLAKECVWTSKYNERGIFVEYNSNPTVKTAVDSCYNSYITSDAKTAVSGGEMFLLTKGQADALSTDVKKCSQASGTDLDGWWLCSQASVRNAVFVAGGSGDVSDGGFDVRRTLGVRPALKLNLSSVIFSSESKTFSLEQKAYHDYDVTTPANREKSGDDLKALQVKFNEKSWYIIADNSTAVDAGTVTLLAAESFGTSEFHDSGNAYSTSTIRTTLDNMTASGSFAGVASAINTVKVKGSDSDTEVDAKLYLLNTTEAENVPENVRKFSGFWWLRSPGNYDYNAAFVYGGSGAVGDHGMYVESTIGVRPALKLNLSSVIFSSESKTFSLKPAATVTKAPTAKSLAYTGQAQGLVNAGEAENGTMWYALGENATTAPADNLYTTSIPTATDAGTYYVWYKVTGDANHQDVAPQKLTVVIERAIAKVEMYRLYNPNSGEHFYTASTQERDDLTALGWNCEGIAWNAPETSSIPVYRLYNPNAGDHHYTPSEDERDMLVNAGWNYEGIGWYSDENMGVPVHRLYNPNATGAGAHHYTTSDEECQNLIDVGWNYEGIGWHGVK